MQTLLPLAGRIAEMLKARGETVAVAESSSGGLISAALLAVPGASAYYIGGGVIYTARARHRLLDITKENVEGMRSASEPYAQLLARRVAARLGATWGCRKPARRGRAAILMATPRATPVSRSAVQWRKRSPWRPGARIAPRTCAPSRQRL